MEALVQDNSRFYKFNILQSKRFIFIFFVLFRIIDIITTIYSNQLGGIEINLVANFWINKLGITILAVPMVLLFYCWYKILSYCTIKYWNNVVWILWIANCLGMIGPINNIIQLTNYYST